MVNLFKSPQMAAAERKTNRRVLVSILPDAPYPQDTANFNGNETKSSKYTSLDFLPLTLFEQFKRFFNVFFLFLAIVQFFPAFQTLNPIVAALPFILILAATILKEGFEDWRRHRLDAEVNERICLTLKNFTNTNTFVWEKRKTSRDRFQASVKERAGKVVPEAGGEVGWQPTTWKTLTVGDLVLIHENDQIPADLLVISTSDKDGICFLETKNLDGETNLKICRAPEETNEITEVADVQRLQAILECDPPQTNLYAFTGSLKIFSGVGKPPKAPSDISTAEAMQNGLSCQASLTIKNILLRGCVLRNTSWVLGLVVFSGADTKIQMNSGKTPQKRSSLEVKMNQFVYLFQKIG